MTGRSAVVGVACRDAATLAVEQINQQGGIDGQMLKLLIRDDGQEESSAKKAVKELVEEKVPVIIGPLLSSMAVVSASVVNGSETIIVSPTASTTMLSSKEDNFLRVYPPSNVVATTMADYLANSSLLRVSILYDVGNRAFTDDWKNYFVERFAARGGEIVHAISFTSGGQHGYGELLAQLLTEKPNAILVLGNSLDTALLAQQAMKLDVKVPLFASEWAMTKALLNAGGRSVEGMRFFHVVDPSSTKQSFHEFKQVYVDRFKRVPTFPAILTYDAMLTVRKGLELGARTGPELKNALLKQRSINTLQSTIRFDAFGDVERELFLTVVKNGKFEAVRR